MAASMADHATAADGGQRHGAPARIPFVEKICYGFGDAGGTIVTG